MCLFLLIFSVNGVCDCNLGWFSRLIVVCNGFFFFVYVFLNWIVCKFCKYMFFGSGGNYGLVNVLILFIFV